MPYLINKLRSTLWRTRRQIRSSLMPTRFKENWIITRKKIRVWGRHLRSSPTPNRTLKQRQQIRSRLRPRKIIQRSTIRSGNAWCKKKSKGSVVKYRQILYYQRITLSRVRHSILKTRYKRSMSSQIWMKNPTRVSLSHQEATL